MTKPRIETKRLILRTFVESDAAALRHFVGNEFETDEAAIAWIHWFDEDFDINDPVMMFAVELKQTGKCIGRAYFHSKAELNREVEIGYNISKEHRSMGYATEAAKAVVWYAFEHAGQDVLSAIVKSENTASCRVVEKIGFVYAGVRNVMDNSGYHEFDYFRLYHTDHLPGPEWDVHTLYKPERMKFFFDDRADGYNNHMLSLNGGDVYKKLGGCFPKTGEALKILNIGCGTGIELEFIWKQAPNAHITCVDVSRGMLDILLSNYRDYQNQISVIEASYIDWSYPESAFDFVVSSATMHHLWPNEKIAVYKKIYIALKSGGSYIEGDFIVDAIHAIQYQKRYEQITAKLTDTLKAGEYHIDIPLTVDVQRKLLLDAGFQSVEVLDEDIKPRGSSAILKAQKSR